MKYKVFLFLLISGSTLLWPVSGFGLNKWKTLKTDSFIIFYDPKHETQALEYLRILEFYRPRIEKLTGSNYTGLPVVLEDVGTITTGWADPIFDRIVLSSSSPSLGELNSTENYPALVGMHEYTHLLHLTNTSNFPEIFSDIFGHIFSPNLYSPNWISEGIAVYSESKMLNYSGRLNDGLYEAYLAARVKENKFPSLSEATNSPLAFPYYQGSYLYGSEFFSYLSQKYGEDRFPYFFTTNGGSILSYFSPFLPLIGLDISSAETYEKSFPQLWKEWKKYEIIKHQDFSIDGQRVTSNGWNVDNTCIYLNKLYYRRNYIKKTGAFRYFSFNEIVERNLTDGQERALVSIPYLFTAPFKIKNGALYYSVAELKKGYHNNSYLGYGFYSILHRKSLTADSDEELAACNLRAFDILDSGAIIYSKDLKDKFGSVIYEYKNKQAKKLFLSDYLINEIVAKDDQNLYISARKDWENYNIYSYNLSTNEYNPLRRTPCYQGNLSLKGNKLFYTANYQQKYCIYSYDFNAGKNYSLTSCSGYATYPSYDELANKLYFTSLTAAGFDIFVKDASFNAFTVTETSFTVQPDFQLSQSSIKEGGYFDNIKTLIPKVWFPVGKSDTQESYWGASLLGQSALGDFTYSGTVLFDTRNKKTDTIFSLASYLFSPLIVSETYDSIDNKSAETGLNYLLRQKLTPGLSLVMPGLSFRRFEDFKRKELSPSLTVKWTYTKTYVRLKSIFPYELDQTYTQGKQRQAYYLYADLQQYIANSEIALNILAINDDLNPDKVFPLIRGYTKKINAHTGVKYGLEYSQPLLKLRWGLWNPNFYFEDLCGVLFYDGVIGRNNQNQYSFGCELHLETKLMFGTNYDFGVRWSLNKENAKTTGVFFKTVY